MRPPIRCEMTAAERDSLAEYVAHLEREVARLERERDEARDDVLRLTRERDEARRQEGDKLQHYRDLALRNQQGMEDAERDEARAEVERLREALGTVQAGAEAIRANRRADDGGPCVCGECSQCLAEVILAITRAALAAVKKGGG